MSLSSARFLAFASRESVVGESKAFCLFGVRGDRPEFDAVNSCGVGAFGVGGRDWYLGEEPPIEFLLAYIKAEGCLTYNSGPFG